MTNRMLAGPVAGPAGRRRPSARLAAATGLILAALAAPALAAPPATLTTFAGDGTYGAAVPGQAASTHIPDPEGLGVDPAGNVYVTDGQTNQVLKITAAGVLSVFAGNGSAGTPVPGPALSSPLGYPYA
ncbi:MAG TPA: hypothetical protein VGK92_01965, partial [Gaiellales bacterium]